MGKKWLLVAAAVALLAILLFMWHETNQSVTAEAKPVKPSEPVASLAVPPAPASNAVTFEMEPPKPVKPPEDPSKPEKYDPQSDEFFFKHDEVVIPNVMRSAVKCWEGMDATKRATFHRNQSIVIKFKQKIVNGTVTMNTPVVERSSIKDAALEKCFVDQVIATTWHDDHLPDWEQDDEVKISPRVLKKYTRENIEYEGKEFTGPKMMTKEEIEADIRKDSPDLDSSTGDLYKQ
jgi:hypothetical protein